MYSNIALPISKRFFLVSRYNIHRIHSMSTYACHMKTDVTELEFLYL